MKNLETTIQNPNKNKLTRAVYIHIPFCTNKCFYCDFNSFVTRDDRLIWDYLYALEREMEETVKQWKPEKLDSIFVGGGTPTFLNPEQMDYFLHTVNRHFPQRADQFEFSMEANPGTTDPEKLKVIKEGGVNRLSFGVQSFDDHLLKKIGRIHDSKQVYQSIYHAEKIGFNNISIDLMFGLPEQTTEQLKDSVQKASRLPIQHVSSYSLKVEENTLFYKLYQKDKLPLPTEEEELNMYLWLMEEMNRLGFKQYEISNFAIPGYESKHNMTYWRNEPYYGIGAGAHGYVNGKRHVNAGPLKRYMKLVFEQGLPRVEEFEVSPQEAMEDFMIMGLRMMKGVSDHRFHQAFGVSLRDVFEKPIDELVSQGLIISDEKSIRLSAKGIPLGNEVFASFLD